MLRALASRCPSASLTSHSCCWTAARQPVVAGGPALHAFSRSNLTRAAAWQRAPLHTARKLAVSARADGKQQCQDGAGIGNRIELQQDADGRLEQAVETETKSILGNFGTGNSMPEPIPLHPFILESLRGLGQVVSSNSTFTGAAITAALLMGDPQLAVMAALGSVTATATARLVGASSEARSAGLMGYNGALVGCAFSVFLGHHLGLIAAATVAGSAGSALIAWKLGGWIAPMPQLMWAFNIVVIGSMAFLKKPSEPASTPMRFGELDPLAWCSAVFSGLSQIFYVDNPLSGALILFGIAGFSPRAAGAAFLGSVLGALTGLFFAEDAADVEAGIWGSNPALTALVISTCFVPVGRAYVTLLCGGAVVTAITSIGVKAALLNTIETPAFTLPFCLVASAALLLGGRVPGLVRAKLPHSF